MQIERIGNRSEPYTRRYPQIRAGTCECCGTLDANVPAEEQYKLCPHFRGIGQIMCTYCDATKNPNDVIGHSIRNVAEHPDKAGTLIVWCDSFKCSEKHLERFQRNR